MKHITPLVLALLASCAPVIVKPRVELEGLQERWHRAAFAHADSVLLVNVTTVRRGSIDVHVTGELRGYLSPQRMILGGDLRGMEAGTSWVVAVWRGDPAYRGGGRVLEKVRDTPDLRRLVSGWISSPWRRTPIVAVVRLASVGADDLGFDVVEVLRGQLPSQQLVARRLRFAPPVESSAPARYADPPWPEGLQSGTQRYILTIWRASTPIHADALVLADDALIDRARHDLASGDHYEAGLRSKTAGSAALEAAALAYQFQTAPIVGEARTVADVDGCVGSYRLAMVQALRGNPSIGLTATACSYEAVMPAGKSVLVAATAEGVVIAQLPLTARGQVQRDLATMPPRFASMPVDDAAPVPRAQPSRRFEPDVPLAAMMPKSYLPSDAAQLRWIPFEVVRRDAHHIVCHALRRSSYERIDVENWMFVGRDLPSWPTGSRLWGAAVAGATPATPLFISIGFLPGNLEWDQVLGLIEQVNPGL